MRALESTNHSPRGPPDESLMVCPECQQPMSKGFAELYGSVANSLFFRAAPVTLNFAATETFEFELLRPSQRTVAFECAGCGTMVLTVQPWVP